MTDPTLVAPFHRVRRLIARAHLFGPDALPAITMRVMAACINRRTLAKTHEIAGRPHAAAVLRGEARGLEDELDVAWGRQLSESIWVGWN